MANKMKKQICVIGLGNIGLPTACILATLGYKVLGVDIDKKVIDRVRSCNLISSEPKLQDLLKKAIESGNLKVSMKILPAEVYIIAVPTLISKNNQPEISCVNAVIAAISPHLKDNDLVLIESTCPIGTTKAIAKKLKNICPLVNVSYCPERVFPGNIFYELIHNDRIVGGVDKASTSQAETFYRSFVKGEVIATDSCVAEAVKLAENSYRDVNIAYANELSMISDQIGLDVKELIFLANKHPRVQILDPGVGVGGHCIAIDPWFLVSSAPKDAILTSKARETNIRKTNWVIQKIRDEIKKNNSRKVACFGLTYKPDVSDIRESPALTIVQTLEKEMEVICVDPYVPNTHEPCDAINQADIIIGLVAHREFLKISNDDLKGKIVLDFAGVFK
ncbi:MAG: nucleotide sugar dehydrogenase [Candidatus Thorarchaeota archaeon]